MAGEEPKIIIDTDWKAQAQADKEKLAQQAAPKSPAKPAGVPGEEGAEEAVNFDEIVRMLAMQALTFLGEIPDPSSGQRMFAPEYARRYIDMINILEQKTKGNLTAEEQEGLTGIASDLRMAYVEMNKAVAKAVAEGRLKPAARGAAGSVGGVGGAGGGPSGARGAGASPIIGG